MYNNNLVYLPGNQNIAQDIHRLQMEAKAGHIHTMVWCFIRRKGEIEIGGAGDIYQHSAALIEGTRTLLYHLK